MREDNEVRVTPRRNRVKPQPKNQTFFSGFFKSLMSNGLIYVIVHIFGLWSFIPVVLAAVLFLFGWKAAPPDETAKKGANVTAQIKAAAGGLTGQADGEHKPVIPSPAGLVAGQATKRIGDKIDDAKTEVVDAIAKKAADKAASDAAAERERLIVEARKLHVPFEATWTTDKLRAEVEHAREELVIRQPLYARAKAAGLDYLEIWPVKELEQKVVKREKWLAENVSYQAKLRAWEDAMQEYRWNLQHGKNSRCPACKHAMRINPEWAKKSLQCPICRTFFSGYRALALWVHPKAPPKPEPPKEWSLFG